LPTKKPKPKAYWDGNRDPVGISWRCLILIKLDWLGYRMVKKNYNDMLSRFHLIPERHGQTDRIVISISRVSVLTRDKNWRIKPSPKLLCVSGVVVSQRASDKAEWRFIPATLCRWRSCFLADQLGFMTRIRERKKERKKACIEADSGLFKHCFWFRYCVYSDNCDLSCCRWLYCKQ